MGTGLREGDGKRQKGEGGEVERRDDVPILGALTARAAFVIGKGGSIGRALDPPGHIMVWRNKSFS